MKYKNDKNLVWFGVFVAIMGALMLAEAIYSGYNKLHSKQAIIELNEKTK